MADSVSPVITEIVAGDGLTLGQGAALIPAHRGGGTATASRLWRWATTGQKRADGALIKLETAKLGTQILTSRAAIARFAAALTAPAGDTPGTTTPPNPTPSARRKAGEAAARRLADAGA